jgi:hypothetical protein
VAIDPYVPTRAEDAPRRSTAIPPARGWRGTRPGELSPGQPQCTLLGIPGPDAGYALTLAERFHHHLQVAPPETAHDAVVLGAALAMRRAATLGRAPIVPDLQLAFTLYGYLGGAPKELVEWRRRAAAGVGHHNYARLRGLVDAVPADVLRKNPDEIAAGLGTSWRQLIGASTEDALA